MAFELRERAGDDPLDVARFAHVGFDDEDVDLRGELANFIAHFIELIDVACDERKPGRAFARETQRHLAPQSLRRAGDQNVFTRQFAHGRNYRTKNTTDTKEEELTFFLGTFVAVVRVPISRRI